MAHKGIHSLVLVLRRAKMSLVSVCSPTFEPECTVSFAIEHSRLEDLAVKQMIQRGGFRGLWFELRFYKKLSHRNDLSAMWLRPETNNGIDTANNRIHILLIV